MVAIIVIESMGKTCLTLFIEANIICFQLAYMCAKEKHLRSFFYIMIFPHFTLFCVKNIISIQKQRIVLKKIFFEYNSRLLIFNETKYHLVPQTLEKHFVVSMKSYKLQVVKSFSYKKKERECCFFM